MSDSNPNHRSKIRTFASDLELVRKMREAEKIAEKPVTPPKPTIDIPIMPSPDKKKSEIKIDKPKIHIGDKKTVLKKLPEISIVEPTKIQPEKVKNEGVTKIPAFHELQKKVNTIQENIVVETPAEKASNEAAAETTPAKLNIGYDATVITDTKADRFQLFPSIINSLRAWFKKLSTEKKRKKIPTYSITETERRKGVIQKATSKSATLFTADSDTIKDQIRKRRIEESAKHEPETTWSPFTDVGYNLLEEGDKTQNVVVEYKKIPEIPQVHQPIEIKADVVSIPEAPVETKESNSSDDTLAEARWAASNEVNRTPVITSQKPRLTVLNKSNPNQVSNANPEPEVKNNNDTVSSLFKQFDPNTTIIVLLVIVVSLIAIILISRSLLNNSTQTAEPIVINLNTEIKPILNKAVAAPISITPSELGNLPTLVKNSAQNTPAGIVELALIAPDSSELAGSYIFSLLHFRTIPNLKQSLSAVRFVTLNHSQPAIVMKFVDIDTVRGGMLQWEAAMPLDMTDLYGVPYGVEPYFSDIEIAGINTRTLNHAGKVVLIYGFLDENTALITNNVEDFTQIVNQTKSN